VSFRRAHAVRLVVGITTPSPLKRSQKMRLNRRETKLLSTFGFLGSKKLAAMQQKKLPHSLSHRGFDPGFEISEL
jgi:hypothetical protein